jgi:hypothetical protein
MAVKLIVCSKIIFYINCFTVLSSNQVDGDFEKLRAMTLKSETVNFSTVSVEAVG